MLLQSVCVWVRLKHLRDGVDDQAGFVDETICVFLGAKFGVLASVTWLALLFRDDGHRTHRLSVTARMLGRGAVGAVVLALLILRAYDYAEVWGVYVAVGCLFLECLFELGGLFTFRRPTTMPALRLHDTEPGFQEKGLEHGLELANAPATTDSARLPV